MCRGLVSYPKFGNVVQFIKTPLLDISADYLLIFGENETIFTADFGFYISVIEAIWKDSKGLFLPSVVNIIHGFVKASFIILHNTLQILLQSFIPENSSLTKMFFYRTAQS